MPRGCSKRASLSKIDGGYSWKVRIPWKPLVLNGEDDTFQFKSNGASFTRLYLRTQSGTGGLTIINSSYFCDWWNRSILWLNLNVRVSPEAPTMNKHAAYSLYLLSLFRSNILLQYFSPVGRFKTIFPLASPLDVNTMKHVPFFKQRNLFRKRLVTTLKLWETPEDSDKEFLY